MPPPSPQSSDAADRSGQRRFRELSRTFWRGVSTTHGLGPALDKLLEGFNSNVGSRRTSVWLHDRRARQMSVIASSDPADALRGTRVRSTDADAPAARGLRLERPEFFEHETDRSLIAPLRGWRRALGAIVIEGAMAPELQDQQLEIAADLARHLSVGIENVQLLEEMLRQRRLLEDTFNSLVDLVIVTDGRQRVVQMNDAFAMRLGQSRADLLERDLSDLVGRELARWTAESEAAAAASHDGARARVFEHPQLGGMFHVTATPLINEDGEPVGTVLVARDITRENALEVEQEALRARLAQSERLASLGQFVAGIAHEINNPLQGVLGHLELLLWSGAKGKPSPATEENPRLRKELKLIYHEADRAAQIVRNLLTFSGSQRIRRRRLRIDRVLTRVLAARRSALARAGIEVVRESGENLPPVLGDQLLLQQAFTNVLVNAEHAISFTGHPGSIRISTTSPSPEIVRITIQDSGPGISASVLPRIFDPFFTTKDVGQGTGLGLTLTYGVIQEHGGTIHATNGPDGGAVFTIDLPVAPPRASELT